MPQLAITNAYVSVENTEVLHGISLTVNPGEVHAIMGPNGSGKSTLAYTLAGHPKYTVDTQKTDIQLNGENLLQMTPDERARHGLFLAFQYPADIPGVPVMSFLRAMWEARFGPLRSPAVKQKTEESNTQNKRFKSILDFHTYIKEQADLLHIPHSLLERNLNEGFSGGERKRVEILQMLLFEPQFAVLDETDSGLDIDALKIVSEGARETVEKFNTGIIVITHYQRILKFLKPDFVHVLVNGKIVESGGKELAEKLEKEGYKKYLKIGE